MADQEIITTADVATVDAAALAPEPRIVAAVATCVASENNPTRAAFIEEATAAALEHAFAHGMPVDDTAAVLALKAAVFEAAAQAYDSGAAALPGEV